MSQQRHETDQVATAINEMSATAHEVAKSAQNAADACDCAWDRYNHEGGSASSGAIRTMVSSCLAELGMEP